MKNSKHICNIIKINKFNKSYYKSYYKSPSLSEIYKKILCLNIVIIHVFII